MIICIYIYIYIYMCICIGLTLTLAQSQQIHNTRKPTTNLTYESTFRLPTKHVY